MYHRSLVLGGLVLVAVLVLIGATYGTFAKPLGRGVVLLGALAAYLSALAHHVSLLYGLRSSRERVAYLVTSAFDEAETQIFADFGGRNLELVGIVTGGGYQPKDLTRVLGTIDELATLVRRERIDRVLCTHKSLNDPKLTRHFCQLRYSGITVMPLIILCEEIEQFVPIELVSPEWLLNASGEPHLLYIKKVKRLFDIIAASVGLMVGLPIVGLAALAVKLTSPGPVFYRQVRSGRFGRTFHILKLRTMRVDAEAGGAQWSSKNDPRITLVGRMLRKYRIDEIPQLWQVLCGYMSFVGPRPERPEIIAKLAAEIPFYEERLMVQPGLTGWAQVSYPYGASVLDTRRKLEYDLYYMKHMGLFLDLFILLDTVRTVLCGGASASESRKLPQPNAVVEWERLKAAETTAVSKLELGAA
ncbi:MAG: exopolysaccharide biosynthesis polyprenyl glycosylphosphotransferase [Verrucomicrobiaceae bacterium]|nr:MAG: exopolysaccharide biosynthesis polyprenyl glycosylphosphotransferase [Verrucomicrobiaceae bacterium]